MSGFRDTFTKEDQKDGLLGYDDTAFYYFAACVLFTVAVPWTYSVIKSLLFGGTPGEAEAFLRSKKRSGSEVRHCKTAAMAAKASVAKDPSGKRCLLSRRIPAEMPEAWGPNMLPFLAVGRVKDHTTIAYYIGTDTPDQQVATKEVFTKLLKAADSKLSAGQRTRLQWNDGSVCCLMDSKGDNLYCVVTSQLTYPERLAYQLLYDLVAAASQISTMGTCPENGLNDELGPKMRELVKHYEDGNNFPQFVLGTSRSSIGTQPSQSFDEDAGADRRKKMMMLGLAVLVLLVVIFGVIYAMPSAMLAMNKASSNVMDVTTKAHRGAAAEMTLHLAESVRAVTRSAYFMTI